MLSARFYCRTAGQMTAQFNMCIKDKLLATYTTTRPQFQAKFLWLARGCIILCFGIMKNMTGNQKLLDVLLRPDMYAQYKVGLFVRVAINTFFYSKQFYKNTKLIFAQNLRTNLKQCLP